VQPSSSSSYVGIPCGLQFRTREGGAWGVSKNSEGGDQEEEGLVVKRVATPDQKEKYDGGF